MKSICIIDTECNLYAWENYTSNLTPINNFAYGHGLQPMTMIRFGGLPPSGLSKNHLTQEDEYGVSCYRAIDNHNGTVIPMIDIRDASNLVTLSGLLERPCWIVTGKVLPQCGSDSEPLLMWATLREEVKMCQYNRIGVIAKLSKIV